MFLYIMLVIGGKMLMVVLFFIGCGGLDVGLVFFGFDVLFVNDILLYVCDVYLYNYLEMDYCFGDVVVIKSFLKVELLVGCYLC